MEAWGCSLTPPLLPLLSLRQMCPQSLLVLPSELCAESDTACLLFCHPPTWPFFLQESLQQLPAWTPHPPASSGLFRNCREPSFRSLHPLSRDHPPPFYLQTFKVLFWGLPHPHFKIVPFPPNCLSPFWCCSSSLVFPFTYFTCILLVDSDSLLNCS